MTTFLFWNLFQQPIAELVAALARQHQVDVLLLAESSIAPATLLQALNPKGTSAQNLYGYAALEDREKVHILTKAPTHFSRISRPPVENERPERDYRWTMGRFQRPGQEEILLVVVHLPDAHNTDLAGRASMCRRLARRIREVERQLGHERTLVAGDFNLQPFDEPMVDADGMHAVMSRRVAEQQGRISNGHYSLFFYNPMWNFFGDLNGPPATYFYRSNTSNEHFWHMFDQVMVRPSLLDRFDTRNVRILIESGEVNLLTRDGQPDKAISDHLPLLWSIDG